MPKISITSLNREIFCPEKTRTVLSVIQDNSIDWMYACGAKGRCTTCSMEVLNGLENLSEPSKNELFYRNQSLLGNSERLACQSILQGDIKIRIPESGRLPHLKYLD